MTKEKFKIFYDLKIKPYIFVFKIIGALTLCLAIYGFGYSNAKNKYAIDTLKLENKQVKETLEHTNKDIEDFNRSEQEKLQKAIAQAKIKQKEYQRQQEDIEYIKDTMRGLEQEYKACVLNQEVVDRVNKKIKEMQGE